jgi:transcriptional regulator with PAS, ATPase and Fis domain
MRMTRSASASHDAIDGMHAGVLRGERPAPPLELGQFVGQSPKMMEMYARIRRAAVVDSTVLILGETGTGKELVAQALHQNSARKNGPFIAVNCAAVPATLIESELFGHVRGAFTGATDRRIGRFEQADGGTLLIDEIGDFALPLQAKLLRVLETLVVAPIGGTAERKTDVRVVAATSRDIHKMVREGTFRQDLFYRLHVVTVSLPPLRERPDDIPLLVEHFLDLMAARNQTPVRHVSPELMMRLIEYRWPGNIRELRNAVESMVVMAERDTLIDSDLPERIARTFEADAGGPAQPEDAVVNAMTLADLEKATILGRLEQNGGDRWRTCRQLGISPRTLFRRLQEYASPLRQEDAMTS